jgi:large subunit ribosomal protein L21|tara:strand:- start:550 stop:825 length:276 start_codon:yes stop_codon:yes gene_type:complete
VSPGQTVDVEKLPVSEGENIEFDKVLLVQDNDNVTVGQPTVKGAKIVAQVVAQKKDKKIVVFKYKNKTRYRRKQGHRQQLTQLSIQQIITG